MSIKGLTDRDLAFPQIGNVRKGGKKDTNAPGRDLTYFRIEFDEKEVEAIKAFNAAYPEKPTEINILLPFNEIEKTWDPYCEAYTAGRMVARSDGEYFLFLVDLATGELLVRDGINVRTGKPEPHREVIGKAGKSDIKCRPVGRLKVIIPELRRLAYLVVHTTSVTDIRNISEQLEAIRTINGGRIQGIPLVLKRRPREISVPKPDGSHVRMTKWMLSIEADPRWVAAKLTQLDYLALPSGNKPALPAVTEASEDYDDDGFDDGDGQPETPNNPDVEDGQFEDQPEPEPKPTPEPTTPALPPLRYQPEQLKARLAELSFTFTEKASQPQRGLVVVTLENILSASTDPNASRKQLLKFLTGKDSSKDIPDNGILALLKWLAPAKDSGGQWNADAMAAREALAAFNACQPDQETLF